MWTRSSLVLKRFEAVSSVSHRFRLLQLSSSLEHIHCSLARLSISVSMYQNSYVTDMNMVE